MCSVHSYKQLKLFLSGKVQGVGFRAATLKKAKDLKQIRGYVRNLDDGRVEVLCLGPEKVVEAFFQWCHRGSMFARVDHIHRREEIPDLTLPPFEIR